MHGKSEKHTDLSACNCLFAQHKYSLATICFEDHLLLLRERNEDESYDPL